VTEPIYSMCTCTHWSWILFNYV